MAHLATPSGSEPPPGEATAMLAPWEWIPSNWAVPGFAWEAAARELHPERRRVAWVSVNYQTIGHRLRRKKPKAMNRRPTHIGKCRPSVLLHCSSTRFLTEITANSSHPEGLSPSERCGRRKQKVPPPCPKLSTF